MIKSCHVSPQKHRIIQVVDTPDSCWFSFFFALLQHDQCTLEIHVKKINATFKVVLLFNIKIIGLQTLLRLKNAA